MEMLDYYPPQHRKEDMEWDIGERMSSHSLYDSSVDVITVSEHKRLMAERAKLLHQIFAERFQKLISTDNSNHQNLTTTNSQHAHMTSAIQQRAPYPPTTPPQAVVLTSHDTAVISKVNQSLVSPEERTSELTANILEGAQKQLAIAYVKNKEQKIPNVVRENEKKKSVLFQVLPEQNKIRKSNDFVRSEMVSRSSLKEVLSDEEDAVVVINQRIDEIKQQIRNLQKNSRGTSQVSLSTPNNQILNPPLSEDNQPTIQNRFRKTQSFAESSSRSKSPRPRGKSDTCPTPKSKIKTAKSFVLKRQKSSIGLPSHATVTRRSSLRKIKWEDDVSPRANQNSASKLKLPTSSYSSPSSPSKSELGTVSPMMMQLLNQKAFLAKKKKIEDQKLRQSVEREEKQRTLLASIKLAEEEANKQESERNKQLMSLKVLPMMLQREVKRIDDRHYELLEKIKLKNGTLNEGLKAEAEEEVKEHLQELGLYQNLDFVNEQYQLREEELQDLRRQVSAQMEANSRLREEVKSEEQYLTDLDKDKFQTAVEEYKKQDFKDAKLKKHHRNIQCVVQSQNLVEEMKLKALKKTEELMEKELQNMKSVITNVAAFDSAVEVDLTCRCCLKILKEAVTLWPCGHSICKSCISLIRIDEETLNCPECGMMVPPETIPNYLVDSIACRWDDDSRDVHQMLSLLNQSVSGIEAELTKWKHKKPELSIRLDS